MSTATVDLTRQRTARYETVRIGQQSFEVEITAPTFAQKMEDNERAADISLRGEWIEHRIKTAVTGWRGLQNQDGTAVEFSFTNLAALCEQYHEVYLQILRLAHEAYRGLSDEEKKS